MFRDHKKKYLLILILLPVVYFGLDFVSRKVKTRKHFIVVSIENFYVEHRLEHDHFYSALRKFASESNINLRFASPKDQLPLNWKIVSDTWPKKIWRNNVVPIGDPGYLIEIKNDLLDLSTKTTLINKKIAENSQKAFFLLINYQTLNPPFYDVQLSENQGANLVKSYIDNPSKYKNKSFLFNMLFDDLKVAKPTSPQSAALNTYTDKTSTNFWFKAYDEEVNSKDALQDAAIIKKLYTERKLLIYKSLQAIITELRIQNELQDTEILILTTLDTQPDDKSRLLEKYFSGYLKMLTSNFSLSPKTKPAWKNLGNPSKLNAELLSRLQDF